MRPTIIDNCPTQRDAKAALKMVRRLRRWDIVEKQGGSPAFAAIYQARYYIRPHGLADRWQLAGVGVSEEEAKILREFLSSPAEAEEWTSWVSRAEAAEAESEAEEWVHCAPTWRVDV